MKKTLCSGRPKGKPCRRVPKVKDKCRRCYMREWKSGERRQHGVPERVNLGPKPARIDFLCRREQYDRLQRLVPEGMQSEVLRTLLDKGLDMIEKALAEKVAEVSP